ncbi:hypothetical protein [Gimesia algae]|uniref:Caspase domain protein n=1 Tax=Gimesia algae TaxID=2527971 RepID=A0A517V8W6_9PLAN|nr:hypothetical protein [Gimesia algae]QDT89432.1 hypothetical protein Pan161_10610 [Gimesia algae]
MHLDKPYGFLTGFFCLSLLLHCQASTAESSDSEKKTERIIVVMGAEGTSEYGQQFADWSERWQQLAAAKQAALTIIGESLDARHSDLELVLQELNRQTEHTATWLILIGHGTFDGKTARFNLRGPDLTAEALSSSCDAIQHPLAVINCFSSSAPFLETLSAKNRVVITATKTGHEFYFSHFGNFLSKAASSKLADLDHDGQISLLEAYLAACRQTAEYYLEKGELATEHAQLDDNADQQGTRGDQFQGLHQVPGSTRTAARLPDGHRAHQFILFTTQRMTLVSGEQKLLRDELEIKILELKQRKASFINLDEYYKQLEPLMIQLANVYRNIDQKDRRTIYDSQVIPANAKKTSQ